MDSITKGMFFEGLVTSLMLFLLLYYGFTLDLFTSFKVGIVCLFCGMVLSLWSAKYGSRRKGGKRRLLIFSLLCVLGLSTKLVWLFINWPVDPYDRSDLDSRYRYLSSAVLSNAFGPESLPAFIGKRFQIEWSIGTMSMMGYAFANRAFRFPEYEQEAREVVSTLIERMLKPDIREFERLYWGWDALDALKEPGSERDRGSIGYLGHLNFLLGTFRMLGGDNRYSELHLGISDALARRVQASHSLFVETFPGEIYVPDNLVVLASLGLFDMAGSTEKYRDLLNRWLERCKMEMTDQRSKVLVPWVQAANGQPVSGFRGSYAAWNLFYLPFIDRQYAREQWGRLKELARMSPVPGFYALREFYPGEHGMADIDSGPVLFGMSTSGTGFAMASASLFEDRETLLGLLRTAEFAGFTVHGATGSRYLLAPLVGDAIVLAGRTAIEWDRRFLNGTVVGPADGSLSPELVAK